MNYIPEHAITDLDESYKPKDLIDALRDLHFKQGPKMLGSTARCATTS
jgi:hypothetical protein